LIGSDSRRADYGVIAIENSIEGIVTSNLDLLAIPMSRFAPKSN
jgi:prephenate dehydratase